MYRRTNSARVAVILLCVITAQAQQPRPQAGGSGEEPPRQAQQTMKQLVRGTQYAAASMAPQATLTAEHILRAGGNAFDAIVAGQAVLGVVQPNLNGVGSDATLLIYDARQKKVPSLNAEGTAPQLAAIQWDRKHTDGQNP